MSPSRPTARCAVTVTHSRATFGRNLARVFFFESKVVAASEGLAAAEPADSGSAAAGDAPGSHNDSDDSDWGQWTSAPAPAAAEAKGDDRADSASAAAALPKPDEIPTLEELLASAVPAHEYAS